MKTAILATLLVSSTAFAPVSQKASSSALKAFENELGAQPPLNFYDPLGLLDNADQAKFDRLRYVELKHGRICMLAVVGYLVQEAGWRFPGMLSISENIAFADVPNGFAALTTVPLAGIAQIVGFIGVLELGGFKQDLGSFPGDFSASPFPVGWISDYSEEEKLRKRAVELNNGRAAQMGILALMVHEQLGVNILPGV